MTRHLNYFYHNNELCLEMNKTFIKYFDTLNDIIKTVNSKLEHETIDIADYDTLQLINLTWIRSKYNVDNDFLEWWDFCIENKYIDYLKNIGKIGDLLYLKNITLDNDLNIKIQNKHNLNNFYRKFLKFDVCLICYFALDHSDDELCTDLFKSIYFKNLINAHEEIDNRVTESYREVTQDFFDDIDRLQKKFDYFDNNHKQDVSHLRTDVESCIFMIDKERKATKTYREEIDMQINDLNSRICKMEFLLSNHDDYESIPKRFVTEDVVAKLEQTIADQEQMIKELREELKKQQENKLPSYSCVKPIRINTKKFKKLNKNNVIQNVNQNDIQSDIQDDY